jgi:hypothetical protein
MTRLTALPDTHFACHWCTKGVRWRTDESGARTWPNACPHCGLHPHPGKVDETVGGKVDPAKAKTAARNRTGAARQKPLGTAPVGQPVLGVDPGATYTGLCLRDGDVVLFAETVVRPKDMNPMDWAKHVLERVREVLFMECPANTLVAFEGVTEPKGFVNGQKASLNPKHIVFTAVVAGAVAGAFPDAPVIPPGGNGSQHITNYPPVLVGRRPADLPGRKSGAGTRDHEQSAYDVAGKGARILYPKVTVPLDFSA